MVRRGALQDIEDVAELYQRSFGTLTFLPLLHTHEEHVRWFSSVLERDELWLYEEEGSIVGFMMLGEEVLDHLFLEPRVFRRGIGTALLELAKELRPAGFTLWTFQQNERARAFYEQHGLEPIQLTDGEGNEEKVPDVQYAWRPSS
jgi:ribosomal protein S18 acetylase RimI-like enzyme